MSDLTRRMWHAVYPGTFDPLTAGHRDVIDRVRRLFDQVTVLVAVNSDKQPTTTQAQRHADVYNSIPDSWANVVVATWSGLTADFCHEHQVTAVVRGVRTSTDLRLEYQLATMNQELGVTTLLVPARPELATVSSTTARAMGAWPDAGPGSEATRT